MFDFRFRFKKCGQVLRYLISLKHESDNYIDIPDGILSTLPGVTESEFLQYIYYLADVDYIEYELSDLPQKDNFLLIAVKPHALSYFAQEERARKQRIKDSLIGFITGAIIASIPWLLDFLSRG